ncbi:hypothetical protein DL93DRAFT_2099559 [Clavulina sp. PMI_390]|nr:hypothetical protein DL93DRAFT_2099559 [Clavulina sp. PMI_390]
MESGCRDGGAGARPQAGGTSLLWSNEGGGEQHEDLGSRGVPEDHGKQVDGNVQNPRARHWPKVAHEHAIDTVRWKTLGTTPAMYARRLMEVECRLQKAAKSSMAVKAGLARGVWVVLVLMGDDGCNSFGLSQTRHRGRLSAIERWRDDEQAGNGDVGGQGQRGGKRRKLGGDGGKESVVFRRSRLSAPPRGSAGARLAPYDLIAS